MTRRIFFTFVLGLGLLSGVASATPFTYIIQVNTPDFGVTGWIDLSFNQANSLDSLPASAFVYNFQQVGYVFDTITQTSLGVAGSFNSPPVVIPNDQAGANFFTQHVVSWGSSFRFTVGFSGPALGNAALDGSAFRVTLYDESFNFLVSPLPDNDVANVAINLDGSLTGTGSVFAGGSATSETVPEPGTACLVFAAAVVAMKLRRRGTGAIA
jgi:hypothetical protein